MLRPHPKFITKFFNPNSLRYYNKGSIRLGTLEYYRSEEFKIISRALHDETDGAFKWSIGGKRVHYKDTTINSGRQGGISLKNVVIDDPGAHYSYSTHYNEYVFCASVGAYSKTQHDNIRLGLGEYPGTFEYTHYAVFDLRKLADSMLRAVKKHSLHDALGAGPFVYGNYITYSKPEERQEIDGDRENSIYTNEDAIDVIFRKPSFFKPENEYRILVQFNYQASPLTGSPPIALQSFGIKRSIVKVGRVV